jgi:hypothetical protein|tara:strand:+ start:260 stop:991 length:732 start_codon:yes stop_codon:yes gene_type:complete
VTAKGYRNRSYVEHPEFSAYPEYSGGRLPRSEWKGRIDHLNEIGGQPYHWHKAEGNKIIHSQRSTPYCWMYGTVAAVQNCLLRQGVGYVNLNPFATAYLGKRGRLRAGYGIEACKYIEDYGITEKEHLPEFTRTMRWSGEAKENAKKHKLVDFEELPKNSTDAVINAILCERCPVTVAFSWWRHLVCCVGVERKGDDYGLIIVNSWGTNWGNNGYETLWGKKSVPFEAVAVRQVRSRDETNDE